MSTTNRPSSYSAFPIVVLSAVLLAGCGGPDVAGTPANNSDNEGAGGGSGTPTPPPARSDGSTTTPAPAKTDAAMAEGTAGSGGGAGSGGESGAGGMGGEAAGGAAGGMVEPPPEPETGTGMGMAVAGPDGIIDLTTSECFNKPADKIRVVPYGTYEHPYMVKNIDGLTFDMRGTRFTANQPRHPVLFNKANSICIIGPTAVGKQARSLTWSQVKNVNTDGDGVGWEDTKGKIIIEGAYIDNMEDGVGPPFDFVPDRTTTFSIRHTYMRYIRDDAIENDGCLKGEMLDTFVDGTHMFLSVRPTLGVSAPGGHHLTVKNSIIRMSCKPDDRADKRGSCPSGTSVGTIFKTRCGGSVNFENVIIMVDGIRDGGWVGGTYKDVVVVMKSGSFPGGVPGGARQTNDVSIYEKARADWFKRHGCNAEGENCSFIKQDKMGVPGPLPETPVVQVQISPAYIGSGNGGGVQWSIQNVKDCKASGEGWNPPLGTEPYGSLNVKRTFVGSTEYKVTCTGNDGKPYSDSYTGVWFAK